MSLVFDFFQTYFKRFWVLVVDDFVENFKYYFLVIETTSITEIRKKKILKVLRGQLFLGHLLYICIYICVCVCVCTNSRAQFQFE